MREAGNHPEERAHDRVTGRARGVPDATPAVRPRTAACRRPHPAMPSLQDALTAALQRRVAQRAARDHGARPPLVGYLCERCLDAPALLVQPAPWGGRWASVPRASRSRPQTTWSPTSDNRLRRHTAHGGAAGCDVSHPRRRCAAVASSHGVRRRVTCAGAGRAAQEEREERLRGLWDAGAASARGHGRSAYEGSTDGAWRIDAPWGHDGCHVPATARGVNLMIVEVLCGVLIFMPISCRTACCRLSTVEIPGTG